MKFCRIKFIVFLFFSHSTDAEKIKLQSMSHFYNSITLLGEFYNRLHHKSQPVLIIGRSLIEVLTKELKIESAMCTNDPMHVFSVQFARLLLTQVSVAFLNAYHFANFHTETSKFSHFQSIR